jgi:type I restriction enzyme, S subunit
MSIQSETARIPKLRFPEFKECYEEHRLSNLLKRYSEKNTDEEFFIEDILSLSSKQGIVDRRELLEDTYSKVNHLSYIKTRLNDFVYGKSISASYPYGLFKVNNCRDGLLSTLYFTFKTFDNVSPIYLDKYFSHYNRANNFLKKYVLVGDRYITAHSDYILSGKILIPTKLEQTKIALFLTSVDTKIKQLSKKQELLGKYKKGLMQKIFSQAIRFNADDGSDYPDWEEKKLGDMLDLVVDNRGKTPPVIREKDIPLIEVNSIGGMNIDYKKVSKFVTSETFDNWFRKYLRNGDILFSTVGKTAVCSIYFDKVKSVIAQNIVGLRFIYENFKFMFYLLTDKKNNHKFKRIEMGAVQPSVKVSQMIHINFLIPSLPEQQKIANFLSSIDSKIEQVTKQLDKSKQFKKALLQQMFV